MLNEEVLPVGDMPSLGDDAACFIRLGNFSFVYANL